MFFTKWPAFKSLFPTEFSSLTRVIWMQILRTTLCAPETGSKMVIQRVCYAKQPQQDSQFCPKLNASSIGKFPGKVHSMLRVRACTTYVSGFLGPKFSKQGSFLLQIFLQYGCSFLPRLIIILGTKARFGTQKSVLPILKLGGRQRPLMMMELKKKDF